LLLLLGDLPVGLWCLVDQRGLAVLVVLVRKCLPRPGHVEKGKFALWIVGFSGEQDALCRVHSINVCLSVTQHLPIPARQKTQRTQTVQAGFCSRTARGANGKFKKGASTENLEQFTNLAASVIGRSDRVVGYGSSTAAAAIEPRGSYTPS
jgi:hypothetical protein